MGTVTVTEKGMGTDATTVPEDESVLLGLIGVASDLHPTHQDHEECPA